MNNEKNQKQSTAHNSSAANCYVAPDCGKIKVKPEGRDGVWLIDTVEALKLVNNFPDEMIHNFLPGAFGVIGADWDKESVIEKINNSERVGLLTGDALKQNYRHALSVIEKNKLYMFDVGEITERDLQVLAT